MRIISGSLKGKGLARLQGDGIRPTPDRVREALFSILASRLGSFAGLRVLDLFAGSGALSLEALSRGAASAVLVDRNEQALRTIHANIAACRLAGQVEVIRGDALEILPRLARRSGFDLIFLDPPYGRGLVDAALRGLAEPGLLNPSGLICAETGRTEAVPDRCGDLFRIDTRNYGSTAVHLFAHDDREASTP